MHVKCVDMIKDDNEPCKDGSNIFEFQDKVDVKVGSDAQKVVLKSDGPCFKTNSA